MDVHPAVNPTHKPIGLSRWRALTTAWLQPDLAAEPGTLKASFSGLTPRTL